MGNMNKSLKVIIKKFGGTKIFSYLMGIIKFKKWEFTSQR